MKNLFIVSALLLSLICAASASAAMTQGIPDSFKEEVLKGTHVTGTDTFKIALFTQASASYSPSASTVYSSTGEITGTGYTAGGATLASCATSLDTTNHVAMWSCTSPSWASSTITANGYVIYNSSKSNKLVYIGTFTSTSSTNGTFTITFPAVTYTAALVRIGP